MMIIAMITTHYEITLIIFNKQIIILRSHDTHLCPFLALLPGLRQEPRTVLLGHIPERGPQRAFRMHTPSEGQCGVKQRRGDVSGAACPAGGSPTYPAGPPS